jgi:tRNA pseudouridine-54 N-methylase
VRIDGAEAQFVRPDERSLAVLVKKALASDGDTDAPEGAFVALKRGVAIARGDAEAAARDLGPGSLWLLEEGAPDVRDVAEVGRGADGDAFFVGDHLGFDDATRERLRALGAQPIAVGPVSVHSEDAITLVANELDRRA